VKKVWSVSYGEYSGYGIDLLFERKKDAEAEVERLKAISSWPNQYVEEFYLVEAGEVLEWVKVYTIRGAIIKKTGGLIADAWVGRERQAFTKHKERPKVTISENFNRWNLAVTGTDREAVLKAYMESFAKLLVETETDGRIPEIGPDDWVENDG